MASSRRQQVTLAGLLLVLAVVLWWQSTRSEPPLPAATASAASTPPPSSAPAAAVPRPAPGAGNSAKVPAVALARLQSERLGVVDSGRDPFRFDGRARRPEAGASVSVLPGATPAAQGPGPVVGRVPAQSGPPPPPPIGLKFIGIVKRSQAGVTLAVLSDGKGVYYGAEGDVIEGRYRILKIGNESVEMAYLDGRGQQRIPLSGA